MNLFISKLTKENILFPHLASTMRQSSNVSFIKKILFSATFVPLEDAMVLHSDDVLNDEKKAI